MVVISVKLSEGDGFLFETTVDTPNDELVASLVDLHNGRLQGRAVVDAARELARHGPIVTMEGGEPRRTGSDVPDVKAADTILRVVAELEEYIDKAQVQRRTSLTESTLRRTHLANVRGAVTIAWPSGLPEHDTVRLALDEPETLLPPNTLLDPSTTTLWVAGREFARDKRVSDRLGRNEKQRVIAKLQSAGAGPPGREPVASEEERNAMMAHYFKRNEDLKKLSSVDDDDYLNSQWADPKEMKKQLNGLGSIKAPGLRF